MASSRRSFLTAAAAAAVGTLASPNAFGRAVKPVGHEAGSSERPNILIFMSEQQQGQTVLPDFPCLTPNLDKFAAQGVLFRNAYCPTPHCCPSRASFQTGLYPSEHGIFNNVDNYTAIHKDPYPGARFFSQYLRHAGYKMAIAGEWGVARDLSAKDCGWEVLGELHYGAQFKGRKISGGMGNPRAYAKAKEQLHHPAKRKFGEIIRPGWGNPEMIRTVASVPGGYEPDDYKAVQDGIAGLKIMVKGEAPWCLMIALPSGGHDPYRATQKFVDMYDPESSEIPPSFLDTLEDKPRIYQRMRYQLWSQLSDKEVRHVIAHYWACLTQADALFGLVLDALEKSGQAENTIVVYTADHGDYMAAHGLWSKGVPAFREGYNIPCVIRWPGGTKHPGRQVDAPVSTTDFAPTFLDAAGIPNAYKTSGNSLLPWLRGEMPADWPDAAYGQVNGMEAYYTQRTVVTKDYKYVYNDFDYDEMYDLKNDPHEMVNLAFPDLKRTRAGMQEWGGLKNPSRLPWPELPPGLEEVRLDLIKKMWTFGNKHQDTIFDPYYTSALAPYGPAVIL